MSENSLDNQAFDETLVPLDQFEHTEELSGSGEIVTRVFVTDSRIPLRQAYGPESVKELARSELPGVYPFTRGLTRDGYRQELWHRDIYAGFGNAEDAQSRYESLLESGASGVNIALDLPTQLGYDSDHPDAVAETGKVGLAVDSFADVVDAFGGISLRDARIVFTVANGIGPMALAWFILLGRQQGVDESEYVIHLQNDPLKEFTGRGAFIFPLEPSLRLACDVVEYAAKHRHMHWKPIGICGSQFRWAGGTAIHEIAFGIASAKTYIDELLRRGLSIDEFAPLLEMHLTADIDLLEEVAKFRAARRVWARVLRDEYGAELPESQHLRISLYTGGYRLTAQEPLNNSVRITLQALAAVLGGVQHIGTLSIDEALATPSAEAARLAVQTQNILAFETSIPSVADPLGGSYLIESLTDELESRIVHRLEEIDAQGGFVAALRAGKLLSTIDGSSYLIQQEIEKAQRTVVGVNRFVDKNAATSSVKTFKIEDASTTRQIERLQARRSQRDDDALQRALGHLVEAAKTNVNMVEPIIEAFEVGATIGELCDELRSVFGTWEDENVVF